MAFETKEDALMRVLSLKRPNCTYCGERMSVWEPPLFPIEDGLGWGTPYLFVCFNNKCPLYDRGWGHIKRNYGRHASYRCICSPEDNVFGCMAVFGEGGATGQIIDDEMAAAKLQAIKTSIEKACARLEDYQATKDWKSILSILFNPNEQDMIRMKAAVILGEIGSLETIDPIRNRQFGNGVLSRRIEASVEQIHERFATRECPFCAEITNKGDTICRHCNSVLPRIDNKNSSKKSAPDRPN